MALSAAELQKRHELEGTPDPFPSLGADTPVKSRAQASFLDTDSEVAFPSLLATPASISRVSSSNSAWATASGPRIKSTGQRAPVFVDSFTLSSINSSQTGKDGKPTTLGDVMKQVMAKYKVKVEASANQRARQTTFHLKAESRKDLDKAKRSLLALLSPVVTLVINAPASTIPSIIGPKGATLKQIRDQTNVRIDIPKREANPPAADGHGNGKAVHDDEDQEELTIPVTLVGPQPLAFEAQTLLKQIIASKAPKYKQRIRDIPVHLMSFVSSSYTTFASDQVNLSLNSDNREITVSGDRGAVGEVVEAVKRMISELESSITSIKMSLPQRQYRLLTGTYAEDVMKQSNCAVVIQGAEVIVWGRSSDLPNGLGAVMAQANSKHIHEFVLPGPAELSKQLATYFARIQLDRIIKNKHPDVESFLPSPRSESESLTIDLIGDKPEVDASVKVVADLIGKLIGGTRGVSIDWLLHRVIIGKNAKRLKQLYETLNIQVYFPSEPLELSQVLLVYDPMTSTAAISPDDKQKRLDDVEKELLKLAREAADVKTEIIGIEKRWHDAVLGKGRTTLNALIGEDTTLSIKVGADATPQTNEDVIMVRGISSEVDRVVKDIRKIVEDAKNDEIVNSYSTEFEIDKEYVGRVVGAQGVGVNKLRDQLGVKVDVFDEVDEKEKESSRKRKVAHQKCRIKITGRKENAEEAKKRIVAQVERLADETFEVLRIPAQHHSSLIGQGGKYAIRLEEKYGVKITFPRHSSEGDGKTREQLKADEVLVKGGKKGVAGAKSELLEALEYEKENNNVLKFTIPTRSVARVLGRGGASINEIKDQTDAQIDIEKGSEDNGASTVITLHGTKQAIAAAKTAIVTISDQVVDETTVSFTVESKYHRNIIGAGGQGLKDLIAKCGGPSDLKSHAGLIRFPRPGEPSDEVRLRGEPNLVAKLKVELERIVSDLRDRVVLGVEVPVAQHRVLIGRGGQNLNNLQNKFHVQIQIPGSHSYEHVGEAENVAELSDVDPACIVKVSGARAACEKAIAHLRSNLKAPAAEVSKEVMVPLKYHNAISQQRSFFRTLRNFGVFVEHSALPTKSGIPSRTTSARIDEAESGVTEWEVVANYQDVDEGNSTWTLKAKDHSSLERAEKLLQESIDHAATLSHVGFLTLADRSLFPRIVGAKGANVTRLRNETGAEITVSRENSTIVIIGTESHIIAAKDAILRMGNGRGRRNE